MSYYRDPRSERQTSYCEVKYDEQENESGYPCDCVVVTCQTGGDSVTIWGHGPSSVKRALASLTESCSCGADWHDVE